MTHIREILREKRPVNPTARGDKKRELLTALPLIYLKKMRNQKLNWS